MSTMSAGRPADSTMRLANWAATMGHGLSQIFFQKNVLTGLLILAAFVVQDWRMGVMVLLGALASTLAGRFMGEPGGETSAGLQGFCGALVGAATFAALGGQGISYFIALAGGLLCAPVTWVVVWIFGTEPLKKLNLPSTTAPFCLVATLVLVGTSALHVSSPLRAAGSSTQAFFESLLTNVSQVVLVNSLVGGALILLGLFIAHWTVGLAAIIGSAVGSLCALALNESTQEIANGLSGYSGVLTAVAFAAVFMRGTWEPWAFAVLGAAVTAVVTLLMHQLSAPTYTWPYILTTWAGLILIHFVPRLQRS